MESLQAREAVRTLGLLVAAGRRRRGWTAAALAERAGVSRTTLHKVERGEGSVAVATVFELATLVGVRLFGVDDARAALMLSERLEDRLALLPARVVPVDDVGLDDDF
jgi:transcriptional regulator with XRE-family HTH domain